MNSLFQKITNFLNGSRENRKTGVIGSSLSSSGPESDFKPKVRPVGESIEIDDVPKGEKLPRKPDGDGWVFENGNYIRRHRFGPRFASEMAEDDEPRHRSSTNLTIQSTNPFRDGK